MSSVLVNYFYNSVIKPHPVGQGVIESNWFPVMRGHSRTLLAKSLLHLEALTQEYVTDSS